MWNIIFLFTGMFFILLLLVVFSSKEVLNSKENKIFKLVLISSLFLYIIEIPLQLIVRTIGVENVLVDIISRLYLISLLVWYVFFSMYVILLYSNDIDKPIYKTISTYAKVVVVALAIVCTMFLICSPIRKFYDLNKMYVIGVAVDILKVFIGIYISLWFVLIILNLKNLFNKKNIPIYLTIVFLIISTIIQSYDPSILIASVVGTFICYTMYFTIENPDLKMLREMELAKNTAEKANRAKSDFLSSMSHEIRTPLNAIVGLSEDIASYKNQVPKEVIEDTEDIQNASQTLLEIVGNILDINKIESEKMEITEVPYNFVEEITRMARVTITRIGNKPIDFKMSFAPDIPFELLGDKSHIKEIINNLLTNAIKYTEKGTITLNTKCINQNNKCILIISVQDTGRGIKAENINKLFTKFERLDIERNTTTEGTGLGLAITKVLVDMMGGHINVQSQFGEGSIFVVQIPQKISKMAGPKDEEKKIEQIEPKERFEEKQYNNKKVLVVDDNKLNIKVAKKHLESLGLIVDDSDSGKQCLDKINQGEKYDLILMDIMMPEMNGKTTLARLQEIPEFNTPVIALTADAVSGAKEKYMAEGFIDYISKPFTKDQIKEKLDKIFLDENNENSKNNFATYVFNSKENEEYTIIDGVKKDVNK